jgi:5'(3')-deoxyribonucleotidase
MGKVRVGIDVDGVLRDFDSKVMEIVKREFPDKVTSDIVHGWDFPNVNMDIKELSKLWRETHCEEIYREAALMPGVIQEFKELRDWARYSPTRYQFVCVTAQMPYNANHTLYWLGKHNFNFMEVFITNNKHTVDIDYLIDDSPKNYDKWIKNERDESSFILFNRPYNTECSATNRINKLSDAISILEN